MRPARREQGIKKVRRIMSVWRQGWGHMHAEFYTDDGYLARRMLHTRCLCSGPCCGNERRHFGLITRQERVADVQMQEWIAEVDG